MTIALAP